MPACVPLSCCLRLSCCLQVAHGLTLQRLESLEHLAATGAAAGSQEGAAAAAPGVGQAGGVLVVASSLKKLQVGGADSQMPFGTQCVRHPQAGTRQGGLLRTELN